MSYAERIKKLEGRIDRTIANAERFSEARKAGDLKEMKKINFALAAEFGVKLSDEGRIIR